MAVWLYFLEPPRDAFAATITEAESEVFGRHFAYLSDLNARGIVQYAGRTLGTTNVGIVIFEAEDEDTARAIMEGDPTIAEGVVTGSLHPFAMSMTPEH